MSRKIRKKPGIVKGVSRREFIRQSASAGTVTVAGWATIQASEKATASGVRADVSLGEAGVLESVVEQRRELPMVDRRAILFAIGDALIPSAPRDPGYRDLEWYGITEEIDRRLADLPDEELEFFNSASLGPLGKRFAELSESQRAEYFSLITRSGGVEDRKKLERLKETYDKVREMVFTVYYQNFPQDHWPMDANGVPLLKAGDEHQITNPNNPDIPTGWDAAGYAGPLTWEEEERRRNYFKKIRWEE